MKKFMFLFVFIFLFEILIQILKLFFNNIFLSIINVIISLPLILIDRSYPFYAEGSIILGMSLFIVNVLLQTIIIYVVYKNINHFRNPNSNNSSK